MKHIKVFKGIDYGFNGFDNPFLMNLIDFFCMSLTVVFTLYFYSYGIS